ncbi:RNA polymerase II C-terminal domain phosphatase-like 5 [Spinacia oleracea]|uniref:protein-serine/threonine phosphatase n=1 Tax=Spinacia oleracea TaxID=3562 RepID=A0A9R0K4P9_SPIOL|nr:RNA polymerase II C-terminal domain phosphatase-like 5 [Spinacia oleracea]
MMMEDGLEVYDYRRQQCVHPSFMNDNCTCCGQHIVDCGVPATTPFGYIHHDLTLTPDEIKRIRDDNLQYLLDNKKLHLVLDLDHTLIHAKRIENLTSEEKESIERVDDIYTIFGGTNYSIAVKLRPGVKEFIEKVSCIFDLSIYTMGSRDYAREVHKLLVSKAGFPVCPWVIAREDCVKEKKKGLGVVLSHEKVVVIVDDTRDVWGSCKENLVRIGRYEYFPVKDADVDADADADDDAELARVYDTLQKVHSEFYFDDNIQLLEGEECSPKDVRDVIKAVKYDELEFASRQLQTSSLMFGVEDEESIALCGRKRPRDDTSIISSAFPLQKEAMSFILNLSMFN